MSLGQSRLAPHYRLLFLRDVHLTAAIPPPHKRPPEFLLPPQMPQASALSSPRSSPGPSCTPRQDTDGSLNPPPLRSPSFTRCIFGRNVKQRHFFATPSACPLAFFFFNRIALLAALCFAMPTCSKPVVISFHWQPRRSALLSPPSPLVSRSFSRLRLLATLCHLVLGRDRPPFRFCLRLTSPPPPNAPAKKFYPKANFFSVSRRASFSRVLSPLITIS